MNKFGFFGCGATLGSCAFGVSTGVAVGPFDAASASAFACSFAASSIGGCNGCWTVSILAGASATAPGSVAVPSCPAVPASSCVRPVASTAPIGVSIPVPRAVLGVGVCAFSAAIVLLALPYWPPPTVMVKRVGVPLSTLPDWSGLYAASKYSVGWVEVKKAACEE